MNRSVIKTAILGGSFNPPHYAHLDMAKYILEKTDVDEVWFMPTANHPFAKDLARAEARIEMLNILISNIPGTYVSDFEIKLYEKNKKPSYTYSTLKELSKRYTDREFSLIIGSDNISNFDKWYEYKKLLKEFKVFVVPRAGIKDEELLNGMELIRDVTESDFSSTKIRENIILNNKVTDFTSSGIENYIITNNLYKEVLKEKGEDMNNIPDILIARDKEKLMADIISNAHKMLTDSPFKKAVIGVSGGVDSSFALCILTKVLGKDNIYPVFLPYGDQSCVDAFKICEHCMVPKENITLINIKDEVDIMASKIDGMSSDRIIKGNTMARARTLHLWNISQIKGAALIGTANLSETLLGYTTIGTSPLAFEFFDYIPKSILVQLASYLGMPKTLAHKTPSAGLWEGQTDEDELGVRYVDIDCYIIGLMYKAIYDKTKNAYYKDAAEEAFKYAGSEKVDKIKSIMKKNYFKLELPNRNKNFINIDDSIIEYKEFIKFFKKYIFE